MHTLWKGSISFGLVNIPVKMHAATESKEFQFNYLHKDCHKRIRYTKRCPTCDVEVNQEDLVKGYQYERDRYVILTDEDLESVEHPMNRSIDIVDFVDLREIDPIFYQKSYYLSPEETAQKAYRLLYQAMEETGKVAVARVTLRSKQHLACLRVFEKGLVMETMFYPEEIRHMDAVWEKVTPTETEISMARQLIENLAKPFEPSVYRDEAREQLANLIESKITGQTLMVEEPREAGKVVDLMEALRASLAAAEKEKGKITGVASSRSEEETVDSITDQNIEKNPSTLTPRKRATRKAKGA